MAKYKFFNIGKANEEIDRLELENTQLKAADKSGDAAKLSEAIASNDQISSQLSQANSDLATANQNISALNTSLAKAQGQATDFSASIAALKTACTAMKLEIKDGASALDMVSAMQSSVTTTLSRLQVPIDKIPAAAPAAKSGDKPKSALTGIARMAAATRIAGVTPK